jgi:glutaminase
MHNTVSRIIHQLYDKYRGCSDGKLADYIPELTRANPDWFGISVATADGHFYSIGDAEQAFTIQSISKAFTFGMVLDELGVNTVEKRIGVEPSGEAFNSISLDPISGRPYNPMINAGAIAATGLVSGDDLDDRFEKIRHCFSRYAGRDLDVDEEVYRSESTTGFRNRAIANLLRNFEMLDDPVDEAVEVYFKQCSILVTCRDLSLMAASLANSGVNPVTGERVLKPDNVERVLSVMSTCGMYDYSGEWIFTVGLPAKSGVGGGVVGVLPGQLGVAVFSPLLDAKGNSVRGVQTFTELSRLFNLHLFNSPAVAGQAIRRVYKLSEVGSHRQRVKAHHEAIRQYGHSVTIVEMQGDFFFSAMEHFVRVQSAHTAETVTFVLDLRRVNLTDSATENVLLAVIKELNADNRQLIVIDPANILEHARYDTKIYDVLFFEDIDIALEYCEELLIQAHVEAPMIKGLVPFHEFEIFNDMTSQELSLIEGLLGMEGFPAGCKMIEQGSDPESIYLLTKGSVSIIYNSSSSSDDQLQQRIAAFGPGVSFGELAVVDCSKRTADVWADEDVTCYTLSLDNLRMLESTSSATHAKIIRNILIINIDRLRRTNQELGSLKS